jgi:hypothetical protein
MQSVQPHLWSDVAYQAVNSLGPAAITAIVSWLAFRSQRRIKQAEMEGQTKLRARELMFNSYQGMMERREKDVTDLGKVLGQVAVALQITDDEEERRKACVALMEVMGSIITPLKGSVVDLENELAQAGLMQKYQSQLSYIKSHVEFDVMAIPYKDIPAKYQAVMTMLGYVSIIQQALLAKKPRGIVSRISSPFNGYQILVLTAPLQGLGVND